MTVFPDSSVVLVIARWLQCGQSIAAGTSRRESIGIGWASGSRG